MGQTRVDLLHLLEDLRDAYPGALEETILTEIVANALDSGARTIALETDAEAATLTVIDDGKGMTRKELTRYHDLAATSKRRGRGIGFAGVGIKLALLVCDEVVTESRRGSTHVASTWHLSSRHRAPWNWTDPPGRVAERGTAVRMRLENPLSPLLDAAYIESAILRHYQPLFDATFQGILRETYPDGVDVHVNGRRISIDAGDSPFRTDVAIRMGRKRRPAALGFLMRVPDPLPEDQRGIAVSTFGKIIRRGWDWLAVTTDAADRITGVIEAPALAESLTLNKADFIRTGPRGANYLSYRKAIQEAISEQLAAWGDAPPPDDTRRAKTRPIERDLENVLLDLADDFPNLAALVERRSGPQRRLPLASPGARPDWSPAAHITLDGEDDRPRDTAEPAAPSEPSAAPPPKPQPPPPPAGEGEATGKRKSPRYGLEIRFESRPDTDDLGRLVESTVWVNTAHAAFIRASASRAEAYHIALTVGMVLAPLAVEPVHAHAFVTTFLARWGEAAQDGTKRGGGHRRR